MRIFSMMRDATPDLFADKIAAMRLTALGIVFVPLALAAAGPVPEDLSKLVEKAGLGPVSAWCAGEFRSKRAGAYAVAIGGKAVGGKYLILERDGTRHELAVFKGAADLSCHTPVEARRLARSIATTETIHGSLKPLGRTAVVCGFVEDTMAECWQYSPSRKRFVNVGGWAT